MAGKMLEDRGDGVSPWTRFSRQRELVDVTFQHYARVEALLERIAVAMERGDQRTS